MTPLFLDGRAAHLLSHSSISEPRGCGGLNCITCLSSTGAGSLVLSPIFVNNPEAVEPLSPDGMDVERFHKLYRQAGEALWARTPSLFTHAWQGLTTLVVDAHIFSEQPIRYIQCLLDVLASALEFDLVDDPPTHIGEFALSFMHAPNAPESLFAFALDEALRTHLKEADPSYAGGIQGPADKRLNEEAWVGHFRGRLQQAPRQSLEPIVLSRGESSSSLNRFLREDRRSECVSELLLPDKTRVSVMRPPVELNGRSELRLAGLRPEDVRRAATALLETIQALRPRNGESREGRQHIRVDGRSLESWETRLLPAEDAADSDLLSMNNEASSARILLGGLT